MFAGDPSSEVTTVTRGTIERGQHPAGPLCCYQTGQVPATMSTDETHPDSGTKRKEALLSLERVRSLV